MCHDESIGCKRTGGHSASTIQTQPPEPEKRCTQKRQGQVMRRHGLVAIAFPLSYYQGCRQCCDSRADMYDKASCKIESAKISNPTTCTPDPVGQRLINKC